jgi:hypothetical protein
MISKIKLQTCCLWLSETDQQKQRKAKDKKTPQP